MDWEKLQPMLVRNVCVPARIQIGLLLHTDKSTIWVNIVGMKTESGEKKGVSEKNKGPSVHNDHINLHTKHNVQYVRWGAEKCMVLLI